MVRVVVPPRVWAYLETFSRVVEPGFGVWYIFIARISPLGPFHLCGSSSGLAPKSQRSQNVLGLSFVADLARG